MFFIADIYVALRNVTTLRKASTLRNVTRSTSYWAVERLSAQTCHQQSYAYYRHLVVLDFKVRVLIIVFSALVEGFGVGKVGKGSFVWGDPSTTT